MPRQRGGNERQSLIFAGPALRWFETLSPPDIRCAVGVPASNSYRLYLPDNVMDKVAAAWSRRNEASIADYRTEKDIHPTHLDGTAVHYLYSICQSVEDVAQHLDVIKLAARSMTHLGWGIDMIAGDASIILPVDVAALPGEQWVVTHDSSTKMRCPRPGTLDQLLVRHHAFLRRIETDNNGQQTFNPVPPIRAFRAISYRRTTDVPSRPNAVFKLVDDNDDTYRHPQSKLVHIAGMVRHIAIDAMRRNPPTGLTDPDGWVNRYVAGHQDRADKEVDLPHAQLSYLPLQSIGHPHTDPGVRRVMIAAPVGDGAILEHLRRHLDGLRLIPERSEDLRGPVFLSNVLRDNVAAFYTAPSNTWASVTPVILPGHDDHKPDKTRRLILKALQQSGIDQPCEFEWSAFSVFPKSLSAHKYDRQKRPAGYIRPDHLLNLSAVHLRIRFENDQQVPGPLAIGAGRHCGLGIFARVDQRSS